MLCTQSEHESTHIQSNKKSVQSSIGAKMFIYSGVGLIHSKKNVQTLCYESMLGFIRQRNLFLALDSIEKKIVKILF